MNIRGEAMDGRPVYVRESFSSVPMVLHGEYIYASLLSYLYMHPSSLISSHSFKMRPHLFFQISLQFLLAAVDLSTVQSFPWDKHNPKTEGTVRTLTANVVHWPIWVKSLLYRTCDHNGYFSPGYCSFMLEEFRARRSSPLIQSRPVQDSVEDSSMQFSSHDTERAGKKYGATRSTTNPRSTSWKPKRACMKYEGDGDMLRSFTLEEFKVIWRVYDGLFIFKKVEKLKNEETGWASGPSFSTTFRALSKDFTLSSPRTSPSGTQVSFLSTARGGDEYGSRSSEPYASSSKWAPTEPGPNGSLRAKEDV